MPPADAGGEEESGLPEYVWRLSLLRSTVIQLLNESYMIERGALVNAYEGIPEEEARAAWHQGVQRLRGPFGRMCEEFRALMREVGYPEKEVEKIQCP